MVMVMVMARALFMVMLLVTFIMMVIPVLVSFMVPITFTFMFMMAGRISLLVPCILDEIDRSAAGIVFAAMLVPVLFMSGWHPQIDWLYLLAGRGLVGNNRFAEYDVWSGRIANFDATVEPGFADAD